MVVDLDRRTARAAADLSGARLAAYRALEERTQAALPGWRVELVPPPLPLPRIDFAKRANTLDAAAT